MTLIMVNFIQFTFIVCLCERERLRLFINSHEHTVNSSRSREHTLTVNISRCEIRGTRTFWRVSVRWSDAEQNRSVQTFKLSQTNNMHTNFEPKRLKQKLDIVEKHENRVHRLTILTGPVWRLCESQWGIELNWVKFHCLVLC